MVEKFKNKKEIYDYLINSKLGLIENEEMADIILPVFTSELTEDPEVMTIVQHLFFIETEDHIIDIIKLFVEELMEYDLSLYKFSLLCGLRGPLEPDAFVKHVNRFSNKKLVREIAKHKQFPPDLRKNFFELTGDVCYLPEEAQDIFVF